jgi:hypothetical protein
MRTQTALRRRSKLTPAVALAALAISSAPAAADAPGVPRTYDAITIDTAEPVSGGSFGWGVAGADLTGDGKDDLIVAQGQADPTRVFAYDGVSGAHIATIAPPELNPGGDDPTLAFVYVETMPDVGSCPGGDGPDADRICDAATVGVGDGIPEIIVASRAKRVNVESPQTTATSTDPPLGRGYVIDGATRAVIKRVDMPLADRRAQAALGGGAQFGRVMASPQAMAPCAGSPAENNSNGIGPCPPTPLASRIGDLDSDGVPDIVVTARSFRETPAQAVPGTECANSTVAFCTNGKAWAYSGAAIPGSDPHAILDTAIYAMQSPIAQTGGGEFGANLFRLGDINTNVATTDCFATPAPPSCAPEFTIAMRGASYPLFAPDETFSAVGAAAIFNGATGALQPFDGGPVVASPEPQRNSQFAGAFNGGRAVGDLGATTLPDMLMTAPQQNALLTDDGKIWAFDPGGGRSWQFASMTDPTPYVGSNYGGAFTGAGNIADGPDVPANELLVAGFHFGTFIDVSNNAVEDVHFVNVQTGKNLMTIPNPGGGRGEGFGVGLIPMGDLNSDGFLDFAASAYQANIGPVPAQGRAWIFKSNNSPPPPPPTRPAPPASGPITPASTGELLKAGACMNKMVGTDLGEMLRGTFAGDTIFGFAGRDTVYGYQGDDCIDAGPGDDKLYGGAGRDKLIGAGGRDDLRGADGRDDLFGGLRNDRLYGGFGRDKIAGGAGRDYINGGPDADRLYGEAGKDRIVGGDGRNHIDGGSGNDSINSFNGETDRVKCGTGNDKVTADAADRLNSCERVTIRKSTRATR